MRVIGIDSSTSAGGVALFEDGIVVADYTLELTTTHSERLLPALEKVMADAEWDKQSVSGIAVAKGPGSFTGLRIGIATAKALAYGWQVPVIGVSTLEALAWQVGWAGRVVCPMIDARRGLVYTQFFRIYTSLTGANGHTINVEPLSEPAQRSVLEVLEGVKRMQEEGPVIVVGDGVQKNREVLHPVWESGQIVIPGSSAVVLHAAAVAELGTRYLMAGQQDDVMQLVPLYLRKSEAEIKWEAQERSKNK